MKKIIVLTLLFSLSVLSVKAQTTVYGTRSRASASTAAASTSLDNRWRFGGNFGFVVGDYTAINVSPQIGYMFNKYLTAGIGVNYSYQHRKDKFLSYTNKYNYHYAGLSAYGRFSPIPYVFAQVQPEYYYIWGNETLNGVKSDIDGKRVPTFLVGAGVNIPMGPNASLTAMLQYDVIQDKNSPYTKDELIYSVGVNVHF